MKKLIAILITLTLLCSSVTVFTVTTSADEGLTGDWVTSRAGDAYKEGITDYTPAAGYQYTVDGFQTITPDFSNCNPYVQAHTRKAYNLKDNNADGNGNALSVKFTVTDFEYGGEFDNKDEWIAITLNSDPVVAQGNPEYGSGLCILIRGAGTGSATAQPHYSDKQNKLFTLFTTLPISPELNEADQEVYTFSIKHDGEDYVMNLCGAEIKDTTGKLKTILDEQCADGAYLGISLMTTVTETSASLLINEFQGDVPYGEDSAEPEANVKNFAEIADSATVAAGQPAVMWDGKIEQCDNMSISHADYTVQDSGIVTLTCNGNVSYINFMLKNEISYEASDFPILAVLTKDCWASSGSFYYMSGKTLGCGSDNLVDFIVDEIELGEGWGLSLVDLTDDPEWQGRINGIRCDFIDIDFANEEYNKFEVAYFGAFRSEEDAKQYANDYLIALLGKLPETEPPTTEEPTTQPPQTEAKTDAATTDAPADETETQPASEGCKSLAAMPVAALIAMLGVAFAAKKKD